MEVTVTLFWKPPQALLKKVKVDLLGIGDKFPTFFCKILLRSGLRESLSRKRMCVCACTEAYADFLLIYRRQNAHKLCFGSEFPAFKLIIYGNKRCYLVWASRSLTSTSTWGKPPFFRSQVKYCFPRGAFPNTPDWLLPSPPILSYFSV